jgi:molybdate transport system substrate-binding protein
MMPRALLAALCAVATLACAGRADAQPMQVFAAASLRNALDEIHAAAAGGGARPVAVYAASSALARQIENGAPAQVFISADIEWMDYLEGKGALQSGTRRNLLGNRLVLVAPSGSSAQASIAPGMALAELLGPSGRLAMGDPQHVPAGRYARAALQKLGVWETVSGRIAATENVRAALAFVARGEAPLGIVYQTDARAEPRTRVVATFPEGLHPPVTYPAALLRGAKPGASQYLQFLSSPQAKSIFTKHGFTPLN